MVQTNPKGQKWSVRMLDNTGPSHRILSGPFFVSTEAPGQQEEEARGG